MSGRRLYMTMLVLVSLLVPSWAWATHARRSVLPIPVGIGDIVKVSGARVGCIARRHGREKALDCRRIGRLAGTYGTIVTPTRVVVVRFRDRRNATIVFSAEHRRLRARSCEAAGS